MKGFLRWEKMDLTRGRRTKQISQELVHRLLAVTQENEKKALSYRDEIKIQSGANLSIQSSSV